MGSCVKCHSERVRTVHTDRRIVTRCQACGHVEREIYGPRRKAGKSEDSHAIEEARG